MALAEAKCTNCGANLKVDNTNEAANCEFCGAAFIVEKAINNYNIANAQINAQTVNVNVGASEKSLIEYAESIIVTNPYEAVKKYKQALSINPQNWEAWFGIVKAYVHIAENKGEHLIAESALAKFGVYQVVRATSRYGSPDSMPVYVSGGFLSDENEVKNAYEKALLYAPEENRKQILDFYETKVTKAKEQAEQYFSNYLNKKNEEEKKKGCYIATAVYGDYNAPQVLVLRRFRDNTLSKSMIGRLFVKTYYRLSPPIARRLKKTRRLNAVVRGVLDRFVVFLSRK